MFCCPCNDNLLDPRFVDPDDLPITEEFNAPIPPHKRRHAAAWLSRYAGAPWKVIGSNLNVTAGRAQQLASSSHLGLMERVSNMYDGTAEKLTHVAPLPASCTATDFEIRMMRDVKPFVHCSNAAKSVCFSYLESLLE